MSLSKSQDFFEKPYVENGTEITFKFLFRRISLSAVRAEGLTFGLVTSTCARAVNIDLAGITTTIVIVHTFFCLTFDIDRTAATAGHCAVGHGTF